MKEIDFIPEWYKSGQKRMNSYHRQYALVTCLFIAMLAWSYASKKIVSRASAEIDSNQKQLDNSKPLEQQYNELKDEIAGLEKKAFILERVRSKVDISAVIAELSHIIEDRIVLGKLSFTSVASGTDSTNVSKSIIRFSARAGSSQSVLPEADSVVKVVVSGVAAQASDVAKLISSLEESPYFCRVLPGYSRNLKVRQRMATEFEIGCYIANYISDDERKSQ